MEFENLGIPFEREKELLVYYKNRKLQKRYKSDFICYNQILIELKALSTASLCKIPSLSK